MYLFSTLKDVSIDVQGGGVDALLGRRHGDIRVQFFMCMGVAIQAITYLKRATVGGLCRGIHIIGRGYTPNIFSLIPTIKIHKTKALRKSMLNKKEDSEKDRTRRGLKN